MVESDCHEYHRIVVKTVARHTGVAICHLPVLNVFDLHFQASVHYSLTSTAHWKKIWKCRESNPRLLSEKQECYLCAIRPLDIITLYSERTSYVSHYIVNLMAVASEFEHRPCHVIWIGSCQQGWGGQLGPGSSGREAPGFQEWNCR